MLATWVMFTYQCPPTAKPHRKSVWGRSVTPWFSGLSDGSHRFVRNGVSGRSPEASPNVTSTGSFGFTFTTTERLS